MKKKNASPHHTRSFASRIREARFKSACVMALLALVIVAPAFNSTYSASRPATASAAKTATKLGSASRAAAVARPQKGDSIVGVADLNVERKGHSATRLQDGRILIVGGEGRKGFVQQVEIFDPASQSFSIIGKMKTARANHSAVMLNDGRVLIAGGVGRKGQLISTEIFDPATDSFSAGPKLTSTRAGHTATVLADGRVLIVGGDGEGSIELLDTAANGFTHIPSRLGVARSIHSAALLKDGNVLIAGGVTADGTRLRSAEIFDLQTMSFSPTRTEMKAARQAALLRVLPDGKVQVIGGNEESSMEMFNAEGRYFTAFARLGADSDQLSDILRAQTRAALIHTGDSQQISIQSLAPGIDVAMLERSGSSLTETNGTGGAVLIGGVNRNGQFIKSSVVMASSTASVTTDKTDYQPGDTVIITGTGWQAGETVQLKIHRDNGEPDELLSAVAEAGGNIHNSELVIKDSDLGVAFLLTATGLSSGYTAQTIFTDGNIKVQPNPTSATFTLTSTIYLTTDCTGTPKSGTPGNPNPSSETVSFPSGATKGVGNTESVKLEAAAFSDQGGAFINWTSPNGDPFTVDPMNPRIICVVGFTGGGSRDYVANYGPGCTAPGVTTNPTNQTVCAGNTATFTAAASGSPAPTVQWQVSTNGGMSFNDIPAATNTSLSFTASAAQNGNQFRAVFTSSCGTATTTAATLTVNTAPVVTVFPVGQVSVGGSPVTFTAAASGSPIPTVQWQVSTNGGMSFSNVPGATNTSLTFTPTPSQIGNLYRAVFTNICGTAIAGTANGGPGAPLLVFDCCLQDEAAKGNQIVFNSVTGDYIFCRINGPQVIGKGTVTMKGCYLTLEHNAPDRRVLAKADKCRRLGSASLQFPAGSTVVYITDKSWSDNTCTCGIPML